MKKVKKSLLTLLSSIFTLAIAINASSSNVFLPKDDAGEDTAIYDEDDSHADLNNPDISNKRASDDDEDEEPTVVVNKVILHYYNEAGGNDGRAFYLWVTGVDGVEYNLDNASDIFSVSEDKTMMTINVDFSDSRFTSFAGKSKLYFIVKYKMKSKTDLNWGGQSDDMQLVYSEFPPLDGSTTCEVWTMPAAGGGIAILSSEAQTKVPGIQLAKFTDWKTITCQFTSSSKNANYELYAFDETYYKIKPKRRSAVAKNYLVKEGTLSSSTNGGSVTISLKYEAHINLVYSLVTHDPSTDSDPTMKDLDKTTTVRFDTLYDSSKWTTYYENTDVQLGAFYSKNQTTFRVYSPVSANMTVMLYDIDTSSEFAKENEKDVADKYDGYHMHYKTGGFWELTIDGDLEGKYYNYQVDNTLGTNIVMDPYATSAGCNGVRGLIYDKDKTNPDNWDSLPLVWDKVTGYDIETPQDLTIYEVHVQDFTGDESWKGNNIRGTYNAFVESDVDVEGTSLSAGYDHLNELGVNAIQLMPVFDHDNDESERDKGELKYNWGYNPLNYNVVEGGYSSDPHDGLARIKEFKNLVLKMSETDAHTRVIMDVVYNHVSSATGSNFHKLMPRYYFRYSGKDYYNEKGEKYQSAGELWDGSGCHNEVATERAMMRKFIVDSVSMWAKEYKIKGFRFDLMGLIDFKTLIEVKKALYDIDPDIYIYGEGWALGYHGEGSDQWKEEHPNEGDPHNFGGFTWQIYNECNNYKTDGVYLGGFNDAFRDAMRGTNGDKNSEGKTYPNSGYLQLGAWKEGDPWYVDFNSLDRIGKGAWGLNTNASTNGVYYPEQTVNYVSCHDNWTLVDQLLQTLPKNGDNHATLERVLNASLAAHAMVMSSNTPAFILGGEEILRTKELVGEIPAYVTEDSWTELYGRKISHNSYNSPLYVNSYKWNNKVEVTIDGETLKDSTYKYNENFKQLIKLHTETVKKRGTQETGEAFLAKTSEGKALTNGLYFSKSDGDWANAIGFQINETFVYLAGGNIGSDALKCEVTEAMKYFANGSYTLTSSSFTFSSQSASAVFLRKRK